MSLLLLKRVGNATLKQGLATYLLIPILEESLLHGPLYSAVLLANCWRLRRERPYVLVNTVEEQDVAGCEMNQMCYISSIRRLASKDPNHVGALRYVGQGDVSPFVPRSEEDFILFMRDPPSADIPLWPSLVTELDAVLLSQSDEFIKIQTADPTVMQLLERLPIADNEYI